MSRVDETRGRGNENRNISSLSSLLHPSSIFTRHSTPSFSSLNPSLDPRHPSLFPSPPTCSRYNPGEHAPAFGLQQGFSVDTPEDVQEGSDQSGPARLVAGPKARAVVTVEILVKQNQIAPVRICPGTLPCRRTPAGAHWHRAEKYPPAGAQAPAPLRTASCSGRNRSGTVP